MCEHRFVCADCGAEKVHVNPNGFGGTGYATCTEGGIEKKVCYDCCAKRDRIEMTARGRAVLYLTEKRAQGGPTTGMTVSNWPGTLSIPVRSWRKGAHNLAGSRTDVWFTDYEGRRWHGVQLGENSQLCRCRRLNAA